MPLSDTSCTKLAGAHTLQYKHPDLGDGDDAVTLGHTSSDGINIVIQTYVEPIMGDQLGPNTFVDGYVTGKSVKLEFVLQDMNTSELQNFWSPWTHFNTSIPNPGNNRFQSITGELVSSIAGQLGIKPVLGATVPSADALKIQVFRGAVVNELQHNFNTGLRILPVVFQALPVWLGGTRSEEERDKQAVYWQQYDAGEDGWL